PETSVNGRARSNQRPSQSPPILITSRSFPHKHRALAQRRTACTSRTAKAIETIRSGELPSDNTGLLPPMCLPDARPYLDPRSQKQLRLDVIASQPEQGPSANSQGLQEVVFVGETLLLTPSKHLAHK